VVGKCVIKERRVGEGVGRVVVGGKGGIVDDSRWEYWVFGRW